MNDQEREAVERIYGQFFAYLDGAADRPDLSQISEDVAAELAAIEAVARVTQNVDIDMIPEFDSDPVAVRLGFRHGPEERRVSGGALAEARRRRGLSVKELADSASANGVTVTVGDIAAMEDDNWSTAATSIVESLADALGIEERDLRVRRQAQSESVTDRLMELGLPIRITEDNDPVLDAATRRSTAIVVAYLDLRVRAVLLDDVVAEDLGSEDVLRTARVILRMAADTSAVALIAGDFDNTTQIVEPADVGDAISAPSGRRICLVPARRPLPLDLAFREFFERHVPQWDALDLSAPVTHTEDWEELVAPHAERFIAIGVSNKFKIAEKKIAYSTLGDRDALSVTSIVRAIAEGVDETNIYARLDEAAELAS